MNPDQERNYSHAYPPPSQYHYYSGPENLYPSDDYRPPRPAPPIWLPPPPSDSEDEDDPTSPNSPYPGHYQNASEYFDGPEDTTRWGRSNFTPEELDTLDHPLKPSNVQKSAPRPPHRNPKSPKSRPPSRKKLMVKILLSLILPSLCFTAAGHLISNLRLDSILFGSIFAIFQAIFWPALILLGIDLVRRGRREQAYNSESPSPTQDRWKLGLWLGLHSILSSISLMSLLVSIQRLNLSVSLALSFSSGIFVILLASIQREKRFSLELVTFSILGYLGYILVGLPAMIKGVGTNAERLTAGIIASLIAAATGVPVTFIFGKFRQYSEQITVFDPLIATSFAFMGSVFILGLKFGVDSSPLFTTRGLTREELNFDPLSAAGLIILVIFGVVLIIVGGRLESNQEEGRGPRGSSSILKLRLLIFAFSCGWQVIRQGLIQPEAFSPILTDIFGSCLVFLAFLLSLGYQFWSLRIETDAKEPPTPFAFIPWLFSRAIKPRR